MKMTDTFYIGLSHWQLLVMNPLQEPQVLNLLMTRLTRNIISQSFHPSRLRCDSLSIPSQSCPGLITSSKQTEFLYGIDYSWNINM